VQIFLYNFRKSFYLLCSINANHIWILPRISLRLLLSVYSSDCECVEYWNIIYSLGFKILQVTREVTKATWFYLLELGFRYVCLVVLFTPYGDASSNASDNTNRKVYSIIINFVCQCLLEYLFMWAYIWSILCYFIMSTCLWLCTVYCSWWK